MKYQQIIDILYVNKPKKKKKNTSTVMYLTIFFLTFANNNK